MTEDPDKNENPTPDPGGLDSLLGGFDFTPEWARGEPGIQSEPPRQDRGRDRRDGGGPRGPRPPDSARRGLQGVRVKPRRDGFDAREGQGGGRGDDRRQDFRGQDQGREHRPYIPRLPIHIDFIPEKQRLSKVVKLIRQTHRAFPMDQIAHKFMEDPAFLSVKFTVKDKAQDAEGLFLYQCLANGLVFTSKEACVQYILEKGLGAYYEEETREVPPPSGNFLCVGRHRGSGKLLGPPNWHGYQRALEALRLELAPGMSPEDFARQVEMVHEAEAIDAWKQQVSVQTFYRRKVEAKPAAAPAPEAAAPEAAEESEAAPEEAPEAVPETASGEAPAAEVTEAAAEPEAEPEAETEAAGEFSLTREQAEKAFLETVVPTLMSHSRRTIMPGYLVPQLSDEALAASVQFHLRREHERPSSIVFALRPAFKHMRLHLFRVEGELMVSGVAPHPLPADQKLAPDLRRILDFVEARPRVPAKEALLTLSAEAGEPTPEMV